MDGPLLGGFLAFQQQAEKDSTDDAFISDSSRMPPDISALHLVNLHDSMESDKGKSTRRHMSLLLALALDTS